MRGDEAKKICPEIQLVQVPVSRGKADFKLYRDAGLEVVSVLARKGTCERASMDEVYLDLTDAAEKMLEETPPESLEIFYKEARRSHILGFHNEVQHWLDELCQELSERLQCDFDDNKRIAHTLTLHARAYVSNDSHLHKNFPSKSCPLRYRAAKIQEDALNLFQAGLREFLGLYKGCERDSERNLEETIDGLVVEVTESEYTAPLPKLDLQEGWKDPWPDEIQDSACSPLMQMQACSTIEQSPDSSKSQQIDFSEEVRNRDGACSLHGLERKRNTLKNKLGKRILSYEVHLQYLVSLVVMFLSIRGRQSMWKMSKMLKGRHARLLGWGQMEIPAEMEDGVTKWMRSIRP